MDVRNPYAMAIDKPSSTDTCPCGRPSLLRIEGISLGLFVLKPCDACFQKMLLVILDGVDRVGS